MRSASRTALATWLMMALAACTHPALRSESTISTLRPAFPAPAEEAAILNGRVIADMAAAAVRGSGPFRYRFMLLDVRSGEPAANHPYALSNRNHRLPFVPEEKQVYQGITDSHGRTDAFAFDVPVATDSWHLRERFGTGPFGEQMRLVDAEDGPIAAMGYTLLICDVSPRYHHGVTDADGNTGYAATVAAVPIILGVRGADPVENEDIDAGEDATRARKECQRHAANSGSQAPL